MGLQLPKNSEEVVNRQRSDVKTELPSSNPWLLASLIGAAITSTANRIFDYYYQIKESLKQAFPNTASGDYLQFWADIKNMSPLEATGSTGFVTFTGVPGSVVGATALVSLGSIEYELQADATIATVIKTVANLTASGTTAVCVTDDDHGLASGMSVTISGANEAAWNTTWDNIEVTGAKSFTFDVDLGITSPATGTISLSYDGATGEVHCTSVGSGTNQDPGTVLTLVSPVAGVDDTAATQYSGLQGGTDDQTEESYQEDVVYAWRNPLTPFNPANIEKQIRSVAGNTRVWVHRVTPEVGATTAYFVRDNDESIIPSVQEVQDAYDAVEPIIPGNTDPHEVYIEAPTAVPINITVSNIVPDNLSMRQAVGETISAYYRGGIEEGEDHLVDRLRSEIFQTYDVTAGERIVSFTLNLPTSDQTINRGEIAVEGTLLVNN
jgi:uncharacterized phage protein gp47/JayE